MTSATVKMHPDQLDVSPETVAGLVSDQFPQWRTLPVRPVTSAGTVNTLFRLGEDLVLRFPLQSAEPEAKREELTREADAARRLLGHVPVPTPVPVAVGAPGHGYPLPWAVYRWLPGTVATGANVADSEPFAADLADFVRAVRSLDAQGRTFAGAGRGGRLVSQDSWVTSCLAQSAALIDTAALHRLWARLRLAPRGGAPDVWTHGDLMPGNLLVAEGRLAAVLDVGGLVPADPALDLMPAWNLMTPGSRTVFRGALGTDDAEWERGKGWAFAQAIGCLHYYRLTNPVMSEIAHRTMSALLDDEAS